MGEVGKQIQMTRNLTNCARTRTQGAVQVDSMQTRNCLWGPDKSIARINYVENNTLIIVVCENTTTIDRDQ